MKAYIAEKEALESNVELLRRRAGDAVIWAVVKGNGYGLGIVPLARLLSAHGVDHFAVTELEEARALREAGFRDEPVLMLSGTANPEEINELLDLNVILTVGSYEDAAAANEAAAGRATVAEVHLKIDTGMGRFGFLPEEADKAVSIYKCMKSLAVSGIYTHFHSATDRKVTQRQFDAFQSVLRQIRDAGFETGMVHCCNSTAFWKYPHMHCDAVRLGSALLGRVAFSGRTGLKRVGYAEAEVAALRWLPAGHTVGYGAGWKARRETRVCVVGVGWYHGFGVDRGFDLFRPRDCIRGVARYLKALVTRRSLYVLVNGARCRVLGHVGMVNLVADVTDVPCKLGDQVVLQINPVLAKGLPVVFR